MRRLGRPAARVALGALLVVAGTGHLTVLRREFQAQVPPWVPLDPDTVVVVSGWVEVVLGLVLVVSPRRFRPAVGLLVALFFIAIFPGNVSQYVNGVDGFGLDTDTGRAVRLLFQPVLVAWALWSTGATGLLRRWWSTRSRRTRAVRPGSR